VNRSSRFYTKVLNLGVEKNISPEKALKIKIVNGISTLSFVIMLITSCIILYMSLTEPGSVSLLNKSYNKISLLGLPQHNVYRIFIIADFMSAAICLLALFLNHLRKYRIAIFLICMAATIVVSFYYSLKGALAAIYYFIPIMMPVVFYDRRRQFIPFVLVNLVLMIVITFFLEGNDGLFRMPPPGGHRLFIYILNFTITFLLVFMISFHFKNENIKSENTLRHKNTMLEFQAKEILSQHNELVNKKMELEIKNTSITDSINYAKNIQTALFPRHELLDEILPEHFILLRPRDVVSGDFYWFTYIEDLSVIAAVDCTGHGVPGAFMSMLGSAFLNEIVNKEYITHPGVILRRLRKEVIRSLHQKGETGESKDGMDIALCVIDKVNRKLQFAGANNPLYIVRRKDAPAPGNYGMLEDVRNILYEIKGDRMTVSVSYSMNNFTMHEIDIVDGDIIYLFSDGFADQFGGPQGKKFSYGNFRRSLLENSSEPLEEQQKRLEARFDEWKGDLNQVDDIMVVGIRL
jgi:serine phosphatase RsbU (regulator of sigma subunit)